MSERNAPLPPLESLRQLAYDLKQASGCKLCHAYESIAQAHGFKTYAAMREAYKQAAGGSNV